MTESASRPDPLEPDPLEQGTQADLVRLARSSVELILELQDPSGAYPASPTFSAYRGYSWFRDGAFIADGVSAAGQEDSASRFFDWCYRILVSRERQVEDIAARARAGNPVSDSEMLPTRFTVAGEDGADEDALVGWRELLHRADHVRKVAGAGRSVSRVRRP